MGNQQETPKDKETVTGSHGATDEGSIASRSLIGSVVSTSVGGYARHCQETGEMASTSHIKYRVRDLAKRELFRRCKSYRGSVSDDMKRKNKGLDARVRAFFQENLKHVKITDDLWRSIQKYTTEALRSKRSSVAEAVKKIFTGKGT